jgi:hypothetical protein
MYTTTRERLFPDKDKTLLISETCSIQTWWLLQPFGDIKRENERPAAAAAATVAKKGVGSLNEAVSSVVGKRGNWF